MGELVAYDMETRGDVAQTSERSTCAMRVSCKRCQCVNEDGICFISRPFLGRNSRSQHRVLYRVKQRTKSKYPRFTVSRIPCIPIRTAPSPTIIMRTMNPFPMHCLDSFLTNASQLIVYLYLSSRKIILLRAPMIKPSDVRPSQFTNQRRYKDGLKSR
jgi:hypothetical protein